MKPKSEIKRLIEAVRRAEAELDAARTLGDVKYAASVLMRARAELKAAEAAVARQPVEPPPRWPAVGPPAAEDRPGWRAS